MDRRQLLKIAAAGGALSLLPSFQCQAREIVNKGWSPGLPNSRSFYRAKGANALRGIGVGKVVILSEFVRRAMGADLLPHLQGLGDCVGHGAGSGVTHLSCARIFLNGKAEEYKGEACTETIYAGSRYEIGALVYDEWAGLLREGSYVRWAVEFLQQYGSLTRGVYGNIDLSQYDPKLAKLWERTGVPDELEPILKQHPVRTFAPVSSYAEARDAIAAGYPVITGSSVGFNVDNFLCRFCNPSGGLDQDGFVNPCGIWMHCQVFVGVDDAYQRKGLLCLNSHGDYLQGPTRHYQPKGSYWVDAHVTDRMFADGDSYAISDYVGFPQPVTQLDYRLL